MSATWHTVRVFISSTFRDMHAERDHLVRVCFPELEERMRTRRLHLVPVDLRWGVTEEQNALEVCLEEIERCRPRFVGILGGRYGWVPEEGGRSITALEIVRGVLDDPAQARYSFFYFRDPAATASVPDTAREDYLEPLGSDAERRLLKLKHEIIDTLLEFSGRRDLARQHDDAPEERLRALEAQAVALPIRIYPTRWDHERQGFAALDRLGELVLDDLWSSIDEEFPAGPAPRLEPLEEERQALELFVESRARGFVGRGAEFDRLESFVGRPGPTPLLVLEAPAGIGKSALLATFVRRLEQRKDRVVLAHFAGMSGRANSALWVLRRFVSDLAAALGRDIEIPEGREDAAALCARLLTEAARERRVVLILDALDQLEADDRDLAWLPAPLPEHVRTVASIASDSTEVLRARLARRFRLEPFELSGLGEPERRELVVRVLAERRKTLLPGQVEQLLSKAAASNPLYLRVALEELTVTGRYETLDAQIRALPDAVEELFSRLLDRLEGDHGEELVRCLLSALAVARDGLSERELLSVLGEPHRPLPQIRWARLVRAFDPYLFERFDLLDIFHRQLREAAENRYLATEAARRAAHEALADLFVGLGREHPRTQRHLTYHLDGARRDRELIELLESGFAETKIASSGTAAEIAEDYDFGLNACERQEDLVHAVRFSLKRSSLAAAADLLRTPGVAEAVGRLAGRTGEFEELRRAEALAAELSPGADQGAEVLLRLASALPGGVERERILGRAHRLAVDEDGDAALLEAEARAALVEPSSAPAHLHSLLARCREEPTRRKIKRLRALALWRLGSREEALEEVDLEGAECDGGRRLEAAARLWWEAADPEAALGLLEDPMTLGGLLAAADHDATLARPLVEIAMEAPPSESVYGLWALRQALSFEGEERAAAVPTGSARWRPVERLALGRLLAGDEVPAAGVDPLVRIGAARTRPPGEADELLAALTESERQRHWRELAEAAAQIGSREWMRRALASGLERTGGAAGGVRHVGRSGWRQLWEDGWLAAVIVPVAAFTPLLYWVMIRGLLQEMAGHSELKRLLLWGLLGLLSAPVIWYLVQISWSALLDGMLTRAARHWPRETERFLGRLEEAFADDPANRARGLRPAALRAATRVALALTDEPRRATLDELARRCCRLLPRLPQGPLRSRWLERAIELLAHRDYAILAAEVAVAAAGEDPQVRRRALYYARRALLARWPSPEDARTRNANLVFASWACLSGVVGAEDPTAGWALLEQLRGADPRGLQTHERTWVRSLLGAGGDPAGMRAALFRLLRWLRERPPERIAGPLLAALWSKAVERAFGRRAARKALAAVGLRVPRRLLFTAGVLVAYGLVLLARLALWRAWDIEPVFLVGATAAPWVLLLIESCLALYVMPVVVGTVLLVGVLTLSLWRAGARRIDFVRRRAFAKRRLTTITVEADHPRRV